MAHTFLRSSQIAAMALGLLQREIILPSLVTRLGLTDFRYAQNDTVTMRVPGVLTARDYEWRTRNNAIVLDDLTETSVPVVLDRHPYSAVAITDEELTLDIVSFSEQVLNPQIRAIVEKLENIVVEKMNGADYPTSHILDFDDYTDGHAALIEARRLLNNQNVPLAGRVVVVGSRIEADLLTTDLLRKADESGSTAALRDATIGQLAGFTVISSNAVPEWSAYAFHRSAFVLANVAPVVPAGANDGAQVSNNGIALRWIRDYDTAYLRDRSVVSTFAGGASVEDGRGAFDGKNVRAVKIEMGVS